MVVSRMTERITPASRLRGEIRLPGDKSISHRYAMLAAVAEGTSRIHHYSTGADCKSTLRCLQALGVHIAEEAGTVCVEGVGLDGLTEPAQMLDAGNSGSTIRMLSGILAAQPFTSRIGGDQSLSRRPMRRIMTPLAEMGAEIHAREGQFPPLEIHGRPLRGIDYTLPVASAQVKTCLLFAGMYASGETVVREPVRTRDHTELALRHFGAEVVVEGKTIRIQSRPRLQGRELSVPGDLSSAAFFLVAALIVPDSDVVIEGVGLNPTRSALLDFLASLGAQVNITSLREMAGELVGDIRIRHSRLKGGVMEGALTAALIDEIPVLAVLGAATEDGLTVRDAAELRVKETDRIATVEQNFRRMGLDIQTTPDGMHIPGRQKFRSGEVDSFGDHRIAMAFAVAALAAEGETLVHGAEAAAVSFPEFFTVLREICR
jgi:3-phosphoshikimate 1-carboxyvinyltransferase